MIANNFLVTFFIKKKSDKTTMIATKLSAYRQSVISS